MYMYTIHIYIGKTIRFCLKLLPGTRFTQMLSRHPCLLFYYVAIYYLNYYLAQGSRSYYEGILVFCFTM